MSCLYITITYARAENKNNYVYSMITKELNVEMSFNKDGAQLTLYMRGEYLHLIRCGNPRTRHKRKKT